MESTTPNEDQKRLDRCLKEWARIKPAAYTIACVSQEKQIICLMYKLEKFDDLRTFVENIEHDHLDELLKEASIFFTMVKTYLHLKIYRRVFALVINSNLPNYSKELVDVWDNAHYRQREDATGKELTPLHRFRIRTRNPPPAHICPDGGRPTSCLPYEAKVILWQWVIHNAKNPYPCSAEKVRLAKETGLSSLQVRTWFANARRRMRKVGANKVLEDKKSKFAITDEIRLSDNGSIGVQPVREIASDIITKDSTPVIRPSSTLLDKILTTGSVREDLTNQAGEHTENPPRDGAVSRGVKSVTSGVSSQLHPAVFEENSNKINQEHARSSYPHLNPAEVTYSYERNPSEHVSKRTPDPEPVWKFPSQLKSMQQPLIDSLNFDRNMTAPTVPTPVELGPYNLDRGNVPNKTFSIPYSQGNTRMFLVSETSRPFTGHSFQTSTPNPMVVSSMDTIYGGMANMNNRTAGALTWQRPSSPRQLHNAYLFFGEDNRHGAPQNEPQISSFCGTKEDAYRPGVQNTRSQSIAVPPDHLSSSMSCNLNSRNYSASDSGYFSSTPRQRALNTESWVSTSRESLYNTVMPSNETNVSQLQRKVPMSSTSSHLPPAQRLFDQCDGDGIYRNFETNRPQEIDTRLSEKGGILHLSPLPAPPSHDRHQPMNPPARHYNMLSSNPAPPNPVVLTRAETARLLASSMNKCPFVSQIFNEGGQVLHHSSTNGPFDCSAVSSSSQPQGYHNGNFPQRFNYFPQTNAASHSLPHGRQNQLQPVCALNVSPEESLMWQKTSALTGQGGTSICMTSESGSEIRYPPDQVLYSARNPFTNSGVKPDQYGRVSSYSDRIPSMESPSIHKEQEVFVAEALLHLSQSATYCLNVETPI